MRDKIPPIVDEHGRDYRVRARQTIGAEHLEAALQWTDRYYEAATREHRSAIDGTSGLHKKFYHAQAVLRVQPPWWKDGSELEHEGYVLDDSVFFSFDPASPEHAKEWTASEWREHFGAPRYTVTALASGRFRVQDNFPVHPGVAFSSLYTRIVAANMPRLIRDGSNEVAPMYATVTFPAQMGAFDVVFGILSGLHAHWEWSGLGVPLTFVCYSSGVDT